MRLYKFSPLSTLLLFLPSILAQTACTQSNALQYTELKEGCSAAQIAADDTGCVQQYCDTEDGSASSLRACFCMALNEGNCGKRDVALYIIEKRAGFTCTSSQTCYVNPADGGLFCLNSDTGDYVGEAGDSGNVNTGAYTAAPGGGTASSSTRRTSSATRSATSRSASAALSSIIESATSRTSARSSTATAIATTKISATVASVSSSGSSSVVVASTTSTARGGKISAGPAVGVLGLFVGLVL